MERELHDDRSCEPATVRALDPRYVPAHDHGWAVLCRSSKQVAVVVPCSPDYLCADLAALQAVLCVGIHGHPCRGPRDTLVVSCSSSEIHDRSKGDHPHCTCRRVCRGHCWGVQASGIGDDRVVPCACVDADPFGERRQARASRFGFTRCAHRRAAILVWIFRVSVDLWEGIVHRRGARREFPSKTKHGRPIGDRV